jgi:hypothetical protein
MFFIVILVDYYSKKIGLWNYPSISGSIGPMAWYSATAIGYGAGFGLLGYWMKVKYGKKGLYLFLICFGIFGFLRDFLYSRFSNMIAFEKGYISYISDIIAYIFGSSIVQIVMAMILEKQKYSK